MIFFTENSCRQGRAAWKRNVYWRKSSQYQLEQLPEAKQEQRGKSLEVLGNSDRACVEKSPSVFVCLSIYDANLNSEEGPLGVMNFNCQQAGIHTGSSS